MTRNTKYYKIKGSDIYYRTLTVLELAFLDNFKSPLNKFEQAGKLAVVNSNKDIPWSKLGQIGREAYERSIQILEDKDSFALSVNTIRNSVKNDTILNLITTILGHIPSISLDYLMNQTVEDLIELVCLCEVISQKKLLKTGKFNKAGTRIFNPSGVQEDEKKSMQQKMDELNASLGYPTSNGNS